MPHPSDRLRLYRAKVKQRDSALRYRLARLGAGLVRARLTWTAAGLFLIAAGLARL